MNKKTQSNKYAMPALPASAQINNVQPIKLSPDQERYLETFIAVEQEQMQVDFLQAMPVIKNPIKHKQLLAEHTKLLQAAKKRLATLSHR